VSLDADGISSASAVLQGSLGARPTDKPTVHATRSVTIAGIYVRIRLVLRCGVIICRIHGRRMSNISTVYLNNY